MDKDMDDLRRSRERFESNHKDRMREVNDALASLERTRNTPPKRTEMDDELDKISAGLDDLAKWLNET